MKFIVHSTPISLPELDDLDRRILEQLQEDSSLTNQDLAQRVHASPPTCLRRVRRLVDEGVIDRQVAILSAEKLGSTLTAIVEITLDVQAAERLDEFERSMLTERAGPPVSTFSDGTMCSTFMSRPDPEPSARPDASPSSSSHN